MAIDLTVPCPGCPRQAAGEYQPQMCAYFVDAIIKIFQYKGNDKIYTAEDDPMVDELETFEMPQDENLSPESEDHQDQPPHKGVLSRLHDEDWQKAQRTVMRLHRNLGHPIQKELVRLLLNKSASSALIEAAKQHQCGLCDLHRSPTAVPISGMPKDAQFNHRVQADTLWVVILDNVNSNRC